MVVSSNELRTMRIGLAELPVDLRRMLRVQIKELIHFVEDVEFEQQHGDILPQVKNALIHRDLTGHQYFVA